MSRVRRRGLSCAEEIASCTSRSRYYFLPRLASSNIRIQTASIILPFNNNDDQSDLPLNRHPKAGPSMLKPHAPTSEHDADIVLSTLTEAPREGETRSRSRSLIPNIQTIGFTNFNLTLNSNERTSNGEVKEQGARGQERAFAWLCAPTPHIVVSFFRRLSDSCIFCLGRCSTPFSGPGVFVSFLSALFLSRYFDSFFEDFLLFFFLSPFT